MTAVQANEQGIKNKQNGRELKGGSGKVAKLIDVEYKWNNGQTKMCEQIDEDRKRLPMATTYVCSNISD